MTETISISIGEALVGKNLNQGDDDAVAHIKGLYANVIDAVTQHGLRATNAQTAAIYNQATIEAITAQMWAVKAITWVEPVVQEVVEPENDAS